MNHNLYKLSLSAAFRTIFFILAISYKLILIASAAGGGACIAADDFGLGGSITVPANPDEGITTQGVTKLLRVNPKKQQIAPWIDSGLYTLGNPPDPKNPTQSRLKLTITGSWNPWGDIEGLDVNECELLDCSPTKKRDRICLPGGKVVNSDIDKLPCTLKNGWGLYGLIAMADSGGKSYYNPNDLSAAINLPKSLFRTFRVAPTVKGARINSSAFDEEPEYEYYFELDATQYCDESGCVKDVHKEGGEYIVRGRLFFKIQDGYYQDNSGVYNVTVTNGVYTEKGFIERTINMFNKQIDRVTKSLYENIVHNLKLITIIRAFLLLYIVITGVMFALGTIKVSQRELIVRLFKFSIVATLISDQSWNFFNTYLFSLCRDGARDIADMIIRATLYYDGNPNSPIYYLPDKASPLTIYDVLLKILTKIPVHAKTWSLLFYEWKLYWIPCIYVGFYFIIISILKSLVLYLLMLIQFALLLIVAPIFIMMLLFQITKELFDIWIKQVVSTGILYIMLATSIGLMVKLIFGQIQALLFFRVCWQTVWKLEILGLTIIDLKFWYPQSASELLSSINAINFFAFLLMAIVFFSIMEKIPEMVDIIIGQGRMPIKEMYASGLNQYRNSFVATKLRQAKVAAYQGAMAAITYVDGGVTAKVVDTVNRGADMAKRMLAKFDEGVGEGRGDGIAQAFDAPDKWISKGSGGGSGSSGGPSNVGGPGGGGAPKNDKVESNEGQ